MPEPARPVESAPAPAGRLLDSRIIRSESTSIFPDYQFLTRYLLRTAEMRLCLLCPRRQPRAPSECRMNELLEYLTTAESGATSTDYGLIAFLISATSLAALVA